MKYAPVVFEVIASGFDTKTFSCCNIVRNFVNCALVAAISVLSELEMDANCDMIHFLFVTSVKNVIIIAINR